MAYATQPGTLPHRVVEFMRRQPAGKTFSTAELCEALDADNTCFSSQMKVPRQHGLVKAEQDLAKHPTCWFWSLGDDVPMIGTIDDGDDDRILPTRQTFNPLPATALPPPPPKPKVRVKVKSTSAKLEIPKFTDPAPAQEIRPQESMPEPAPEVPKRFDAWLSGLTGELVLQGVQIDADGDVTLTGEQSNVVRRLYMGVQP